jgi:preprotein translocase subunit SecE
MENRKRLLPQVLAVLVALAALAYVLALLKITVVKGTTLSRIVENMATGRSTSRLETAKISWPGRPSGCGAPSVTACWWPRPSA